MTTKRGRLTADLVREQYPWLSDYGIEQATEPTEYFVRSMDNAKWQRDCEARGLDPESEEAGDALYYWGYTTITDAETLDMARLEARKLLEEDPLCLPAIYKRTEVEMDEDFFWGRAIPSWRWEEEVVEEVGE